MKLGLTFDDVALVPQFNNIPSRTEPDLSTWLTKNLRMSLPFMPANMESVIGDKLVEICVNNGIVPILHRFQDPKRIAETVKKFDGNCITSIGLNDYKEILQTLAVEKAPPEKGVLIDIAHGHDIRVMNLIELLREDHGYVNVIAGNVCTTTAYHDLVNAGASAVKVGIGPGAACTTRRVTGFGMPQFTALREVAEVAKKLRVPVIADGGIRGSRDVVLALAAGATSVMIGSLFAATKESAAIKVKDEWGWDAVYRGQASAAFQSDYYGEVKKGTVPEGEEVYLQVTESAQDLIDRLTGGIRSGLTYGGARSIDELQRKAEFIEVTSAYHGR